MDWQVVRILYGYGALYDYLKKTLDITANVNTLRNPDYFGKYLIHYACQNGDEKALRYLLNRGADVKCIDRAGRIPLVYAVNRAHDNCVRVLLAAGCKSSIPPTIFERCIEVARNDQDSTLCIFIANGMRIAKHLSRYLLFIESKTFHYEEHVKECIRRITLLLALKKRHIQSMNHLDRFLIRELALTMWTERHKFD